MGQGMNVSMQDDYNLGLKLGSVLSGTTDRRILSTYNSERRPVAIELIDLDKKMCQFYSEGPSSASKEYERFRNEFSEFLSGVSVTYKPSTLMTESTADYSATSGNFASRASLSSVQSLAKGITLGQRMPSHKIVCQYESRVVHLSEMLPSNGKWRILVLAADLTSPQRLRVVQNLGTALEKLLKEYPSREDNKHSIIEVLLLHSGSRASIEIFDLCQIYHPWDDVLGWDYWKIFSDNAYEFEPCDSAYEKYGVGKTEGCLVVLRPDQHVSYVGPLDDLEPVRSFFENFLNGVTS